MRVLSAALLLGLVALPAVSLSAAAETPVAVRVGDHAGFSRLVLDMPVPTAPAVALLLLRELGLHQPQAQAISDGRTRRPVGLTLGLTLGLGALLGFLIVRTDAAFAELGRRAAAEQIAPRVQNGESVWFVGRWGFQWYAQRAGARTVTRTPPWPAPGSIVVASNRAADSCLIEVVKKKRLVTQLGDIHWGGRVMADEVGAGFFSNGWGLLPWMVSAEPLDRYDVYRVE